MIAGVCGGLAAYLQVDATLVRAVFVIAGIFSAGLFILGYVALLFLMPLPGQRAPIEDIWPSAGPPPRPDGESGGSASATSEPGVARAPLDPADEARRQRWIGYLLLGLGAVFLLGSVGGIRFVRWEIVLSLALIAVGLYFVVRRGRT